MQTHSIDQAKITTVILDRETNIGQLSLKKRKKPLWSSMPPSANNIDDQYILWNNCYSTNLPMQTKVNFIVATCIKKSWPSSFAKYSNHRPAIYTIPVGVLQEACHKTKIAPHFYDYCLSFGDRKAYWLVGTAVVRAKRIAEQNLWHLWKRWRRRQVALSDW